MSFFAAAEHAETIRYDEGIPRLDVDVTISREMFEEIRQGHRCPRCYEAQKEAYPKVCELAAPDGTLLCGFPIHDRLADFLAKEIDGEKWIGPRLSTDEKFAQIAEDDQRRKVARDGNSFQMWLPPNADLS